jgi:hypothetical protein
MAKKKTSRPAARGAKKKMVVSKKKATPRKKAKAAPKPRMAAVAYETGLEDPSCVNFKPLKAQISAHLARLDTAKNVTPEIQNAIRALRQVQFELDSECSPTMIIPT